MGPPSRPLGGDDEDQIANERRAVRHAVPAADRQCADNRCDRHGADRDPDRRDGRGPGARRATRVPVADGTESATRLTTISVSHESDHRIILREYVKI